jgi:hypothetical protein
MKVPSDPSRPPSRQSASAHELPPPSELPDPSTLPANPDLPDPFETFAGDAVESPADWPARRAEILELFRRYVYGYAPDPPVIEAAVERTPGVLDGAATLTEVTISFPDLPAGAPSITLALFLPADADGDSPVPVVLGLNRDGNQVTVDDETVTALGAADRSDRSDAPPHGARSNIWCVDRIVDRGYGFATYCCEELAPDSEAAGDEVASDEGASDQSAAGIHAYYDVADLSGPPGSEWGTLAAWAWGLHRCVDVLRAADGVHANQIAVLGHSRRGKAALWAGATDERIALVIPHQSGTGGVTLARANDQESIADITGAFPHWFADDFAAFADREPHLPVDQHLLVACVAPRPLLDTEGSFDVWTNPDLAAESVRAAAPVWDFLDTDGMVGEGVLAGDDAITPEAAGDLCQYRRDTEHTLNRGYWDAILDFADCHFE